MNPLRKVYCRAYQLVFKIAIPILPYRHPKIVGSVRELREEDIPKLAHYADREANPLYPVPVLMDAKELEKYYYMVLEKEE